MDQWKVLVVDDHPLMRRGICQLLGYEAEFSTVVEASNGADAIAISLEDPEPDLILLDLNMKGMSGLETLKALRAEGITARVIILTVSDSKQDIATLVKNGADGYLLKDTEPDDIISLLKQAMSGDKVYSSEIKLYIDQGLSSESPLDTLTDRERQIRIRPINPAFN